MNDKNSDLTGQERRELRKQEQITQQLQRERIKIFRRLALWGVAILAVVGVIFGLIKLVSQPSTSQQPTTTSAITDKDWIKGNRNAQVTLIEYSDFQCPACANYYPLIKRLTSELGDKIVFAYRHFPLKQVHPNAERAAVAAEAAGAQGKFWEMHDILFENQNAWSGERNPKESFVKYAQILNLDITQFKNDLDSKEIKDKVRGDYRLGIATKVDSTPSFFLNGQKIENPRSYEEFARLINPSNP